MPDSYLVIGGSGLLGGHVVDQLVARGETSVASFDIAPGSFDQRVRTFVGNICDRAELENAVKESGATCIIHTASLLQGKSKEQVYKVNVGGTENVVEVAKAQHVSKLVYTSSASVVFAGSDQPNVDESAPYPAKAFDDYNAAKAIAEQLVLKTNGYQGLSTVSLRVAGLFGPRDRVTVPTIMGIMMSKRSGMQIGDNKNLFDWTYIENAAQAHLLAADRLSPDHAKYKLVAGEAFFISNGEPRPYWDFPRGLWKAAGHTPKKITVIPKGIAMVIAVIMELVAWIRGSEATLTRFRVHYICLTRYCNIDKARNALDYHPLFSIDEGIRRSAEYWMSTHPEDVAKLRETQ
ncbi:hypothetical protein PHLGIDRAFT_96543 [Phlebiopsis gigantea 11061_1 CR5-6]|uniref:3-beta hydroxysteroid dehydrogenase/isomerase domain-containing protein n=1 Tax=Phlebiopsis gigantea (strain 11061_1 CR5-6) TaxID=745531 RepID=A0A0C3PAR8_PHLG1|nr:hypothetical protein PHLGIDRAFT_96543 [Phlebiopsis gigantea 11061_1 CR5-6]